MNTIQTMKNHAKKTLQIAALSAAMLVNVNGFAACSDYDDSWGGTALHKAAYCGDTAEAKRLIKAGADVNVQNNGGWTPLHWVARNGQTETALALIKAGADVNVQNEADYTPLHWAAWPGNTETALALIKAGADVNAQDGNGSTPLHFAALKGKTETVHALIKAGADVNVQNNDGKTPLDWATPAIIRAIKEQHQKQIANMPNTIKQARVAYKVGNFKAAFPLVKQLAELNDEWGMARLGEMYENGKGTDKDIELAKKWYKAAADEYANDFAIERFYSLP